MERDASTTLAALTGATRSSPSQLQLLWRRPRASDARSPTQVSRLSPQRRLRSPDA